MVLIRHAEPHKDILKMALPLISASKPPGHTDITPFPKLPSSVQQNVWDMFWKHLWLEVLVKAVGFISR